MKKNARLPQAVAARARFAAASVGKDYCVFWRDARNKAPVCRDCSLVNYGRDCQNNPAGTRDVLMSDAFTRVYDKYALDLERLKEK